MRMSFRKGALIASAFAVGAIAWAASTAQQGEGLKGLIAAPSELFSAVTGSGITASTQPQSEWAARCPGAAQTATTGSFDTSTMPALVDTDLRTAPQTELLYKRRDLLVNMDYSYGIAVEDFDCDSKWDISMFDSWGGRRERVMGALGFLSYRGGPPTMITWLERWPELNRPFNTPYLFERHITFDINGDKLPDIVGVANSHGAVIAYINPGTDAMIGSWQRRYINTNTPGPISLAANDIDGDGLTDLVVTMRVQPSTDPDPAIRGVVWLKNPGAANTDEWASSAIGPSDDLVDPRNLQIADFDKDGRPDVYVADAATGAVTTFLQTSPGQWARYSQNASAWHGHFGTMIDEDGDGVPEIIQPAYLSIMVMKFDPVTKIWDRKFIASFTQEDDLILTGDIATADMDGDGSSDIVFSILSLSSDSNGSRRGGIYMMRKANDWKIETVVHTNHSVVEIKLVDMTGNGVPDIVANAEYPSQSVSVYRRAFYAPGDGPARQ